MNIREHSTASTISVARVLDDIEALLLRDLASDIRAVRLEGIGNVHVVTLLVAEGRAVDGAHTRHDRASVHDDRRAVVASCSHRARGHVFVASSGCQDETGHLKRKRV